MRIFYALEFPDEVRRAMFKNLLEIKKHTLRGSFTRRENFHVTLLFVGDCEPDSLAIYKKAMDSAVAKLKPMPFKARIDGIGTFPRHDGDILWAGMQTEPDTILNEINNALLGELRELNIDIKQDHSRFVPHVTISRKTAFVYNHLSHVKFEPIDFSVRSIILMESIFDNGIVYKSLHESKF